MVFTLLFWTGEAAAGPLAERLASFPNWDKPSVQQAEGDLVYPDWMTGNWNVTSTLVDLVAPFAPIVTPGFESNRQYLNQPVTFQVRFIEKAVNRRRLKIWEWDSAVVRREEKGIQLSSPHLPIPPSPHLSIVADRAFNGLSLARAYLGDRSVLAVKVDPDSPNRQITLLRGDRQLVSVVTGRATETPDTDQFITTEVFQQQFRGTTRPYFNQVESTTAYQHHLSVTAIEADQVTAVYLSSQDPDYFTAGSRPVALYRYRLEFFR